MRTWTEVIVGWCVGLVIGFAGTRYVVWPLVRWRRRLRSEVRLVAWGGRPGWDVQVGSWQDMTRVCDQLLEHARRGLSLLAELTLLQDELNARRLLRRDSVVRVEGGTLKPR